MMRARTVAGSLLTGFYARPESNRRRDNAHMQAEAKQEEGGVLRRNINAWMMKNSI